MQGCKYLLQHIIFFYLINSLPSALSDHVRLLASHQSEPGSITGRCRWSAGFLGDLPFTPPFHSGAAPYSPHYFLICSQDLDVMSRPNLFTLKNFPMNDVLPTWSFSAHWRFRSKRAIRLTLTVVPSAPSLLRARCWTGVRCFRRAACTYGTSNSDPIILLLESLKKSSVQGEYGRLHLSVARPEQHFTLCSPYASHIAGRKKYKSRRVEEVSKELPPVLSCNIPDAYVVLSASQAGDRVEGCYSIPETGRKAFACLRCRSVLVSERDDLHVTPERLGKVSYQATVRFDEWCFSTRYPVAMQVREMLVAAPCLLNSSLLWRKAWVVSWHLGPTTRRGLGMKGRGKLEIPEKTRRPTASSGTIPTCENPVTRSGIEPGSPWWEASVLIA
ncbi:hypothetical protein PR048_021976 [Dryococelus australis]|uniref:Uncharacterized protein n=1 Tax=Dryococelus australis TaxID=614101 RepID=A0ABQ9GZY9_9NEOP|nr:hypothetical protein PR048_021976 [Dryococelus australis]